MTNYIDGFAFPISNNHVEKYKSIVESVAEIWKEFGALAYYEFIGEELELEGTLSFPNLLNARKDETIVFGWIVFDSKELRDRAHKSVADDVRMNELVGPLMDPSQPIFEAQRMVFGGFKSFIELT